MIAFKLEEIFLDYYRMYPGTIIIIIINIMF